MEELNVTLEGGHEPPGGGVRLQISTNGLNYMTQMAESAVPKLLSNVTVPEVSSGAVSLKKITIKREPEFHN